MQVVSTPPIPFDEGVTVALTDCHIFQDAKDYLASKSTTYKNIDLDLELYLPRTD